MEAESSPLTPYLMQNNAAENEEVSARNNQAERRKEEASHAIDEHLLEPEQVAERYTSRVNFSSIPHSQGLTDQLLQERLAKDGRNELSPPKKTHPFITYLKKLFGIFNSMLIVSSILGFVLYIIDSSDPMNVKKSL
jgi:sodium/potassium-transporting ATPase subunit alpha